MNLRDFTQSHEGDTLASSGKCDIEFRVFPFNKESSRAVRRCWLKFETADSFNSSSTVPTHHGVTSTDVIGQFRCSRSGSRRNLGKVAEALGLRGCWQRNDSPHECRHGVVAFDAEDLNAADTGDNCRYPFYRYQFQEHCDVLRVGALVSYLGGDGLRRRAPEGGDGLRRMASCGGQQHYVPMPGLGDRDRFCRKQGLDDSVNEANGAMSASPLLDGGVLGEFV